jgi:hypothetical protein
MFAPLTTRSGLCTRRRCRPFQGTPRGERSTGSRGAPGWSCAVVPTLGRQRRPSDRYRDCMPTRWLDQYYTRLFSRTIIHFLYGLDCCGDHDCLAERHADIHLGQGQAAIALLKDNPRRNLLRSNHHMRMAPCKLGRQQQCGRDIAIRCRRRRARWQRRCGVAAVRMVVSVAVGVVRTCVKKQPFSFFIKLNGNHDPPRQAWDRRKGRLEETVRFGVPVIGPGAVYAVWLTIVRMTVALSSSCLTATVWPPTAIFSAAAQLPYHVKAFVV